MLPTRLLGAALALAMLGVSPAPASGGEGTAIAAGSAGGLLIAAACSFLTRGPVPDQAEEADGFHRRGWLVGARGSYAFQDLRGDVSKLLTGPRVALASTSVDDSFGIGGHAGYRCHPRFSAAVQVEWVDGFEGEITSQGSPVVRFDAEPRVLTANARFHLLTGRFQPFFLLGAGGITAEFDVEDTRGLGGYRDDRDADFVARFGGGLDVYVTPRVVVNLGLDYVRAWDTLEDFIYLSLGGGLEYRF